MALRATLGVDLPAIPTVSGFLRFYNLMKLTLCIPCGPNSMNGGVADGCVLGVPLPDDSVEEKALGPSPNSHSEEIYVSWLGLPEFHVRWSDMS